MNESIKAVLSLVLIIATLMTVAAWCDDHPNERARNLRLGITLVTVLVLGTLLWLRFRPDRVHDFLRDYSENYFNRGGFCFSFAMTVVDGTAYMVAFYQNQRDRSCLGRIALRPAQGFLLGRRDIEAITFEVDCGPAAFGVAKIPIPIPGKYQGKRQSFEVGASVSYPNGKGRRLRFRDGICLRRNSSFGDTFSTALTVAGAMGGMIVLSKPATAKIQLPIGVREFVPEELAPEVMTLWELGDPVERVAGTVNGGMEVLDA